MNKCYTKRPTWYVLYDGTNTEDVGILLGQTGSSSYKVSVLPDKKIRITNGSPLFTHWTGGDDWECDVNVGDYITVDLSQPTVERVWSWSPKAFHERFVIEEELHAEPK